MKFKNPFSRENRSNSTVNANGLFAAAWSMLTNTKPTASGELVNQVIAMQHISVYACVRVIAESVGSLTLKLYQHETKGRSLALADPIYRLLAVSPNDEMSAPVLWEQSAGSMAITGNSYIEIIRDTKTGKPVALYPLSSLQTEPFRLPPVNGVGQPLAYKTSVGLTNGQTRIVQGKDMLHFRLFSWDGLKGLSPIQQAEQTIGSARAAEKFAAKHFGNGSKPSGILTPNGKVSDQDLVNFKKFWESNNGGENQGRVSAMPFDWKFTPIQMTPNDSQFLQTRQYTRSDIAALFRVPPNLIGDTSRLSNANHEQQSLQFVTDTLRPYLVKIEAEIAKKLLPSDGSMFVEFDVSDRLRGDFATTMQGFAIGKQWGFYNTNTVLEKLGENPIGPEGDVYWAPFNMTNAANLIAIAEPVPDPNLEPPLSPAVRSMFQSYIQPFAGMFRDAVGRVTARSKRDIDTVSPILSPALDAMVSLVEQEARSQFSLADDWHASDKIVRDYLKGVAARSADWTPENRDDKAGEELSKAIRSIHIGIYREAGSAIAMRIINVEQDTHDSQAA